MPYFNYKNNHLFFREKGKGDLLIILPGNTASSVWHEEEIHYFSEYYHVAALDFLGTGQSDRLSQWPQDWFYEGACQAKALVDFLEETSCIVMGTSGGSISALLMAIHFPEHVSAVIADSCVEKFSPDGLREEVNGRKKNTPEQLEFWKTAHGDDWETIVRADNDLLLHMAEKGGDCFHGQLTKITCPVLLTASLNDTFLPPDAGEQICNMGKQIPDSHIYLSHPGDHPLMWTQPGPFRQISQLFLNNI